MRDLMKIKDYIKVTTGAKIASAKCILQEINDIELERDPEIKDIIKRLQKKERDIYLKVFPRVKDE